jgi:hypothetical protein
MLICKIELWPHGDSSRAVNLGVVEIANVGGTVSRGEYAVKLSKSKDEARKRGNWKAGAVTNFPRLKLGAYDLLLRALAAVIGDRNPDAHDLVKTRCSILEEDYGEGHGDPNEAS